MCKLGYTACPGISSWTYRLLSISCFVPSCPHKHHCHHASPSDCEMHDCDMTCEFPYIVIVCRLHGHSLQPLTSMQAVAFCVLLPRLGAHTAFQAAMKAQHCSRQCYWYMQAACPLAAAHFQPSDHCPPGSGKPADTPYLCICSYSSARQRRITQRQGQWGPDTALTRMLPAPLQLPL